MYLSGRREIPTPAVRRGHDGRELTVTGAQENNLRDVDVSFPLGNLVAVTGVSGSGKSTLVNDILYNVLANKLNGARQVPGRHKSVKGLDQLDKVVHVDQSPIGRTPRSNPATYTGVFDNMRKLFAETTEAKVRGYLPGRFSFNVKGGRCEACSGDGTIKIEMNFLPDVYVPCEVCHGARYNRETLEVHFKGKTIADVLDMPIEEAPTSSRRCPRSPGTCGRSTTSVSATSGSGQPAPTLSGGEAQRVKLASELQKRSTGRSVYVLDEPTTGLHFEDIRKLLDVLQGLVDKGNTVIVIEHNLDVIKNADWIIDLGPEGGSGGGLVIAEGHPRTSPRPDAHRPLPQAEVLGRPGRRRPGRRPPSPGDVNAGEASRRTGAVEGPGEVGRAPRTKPRCRNARVPVLDLDGTLVDRCRRGYGRHRGPRPVWPRPAPTSRPRQAARRGVLPDCPQGWAAVRYAPPPRLPPTPRAAPARRGLGGADRPPRGGAPRSLERGLAREQSWRGQSCRGSAIRAGRPPATGFCSGSSRLSKRRSPASARGRARHVRARRA